MADVMTGAPRDHRSMEADLVLEGAGCARCTTGRRTTSARVYSPCGSCSAADAGMSVLKHFSARNWVLTTGGLCKYLIEKPKGYTFVAVRWSESLGTHAGAELGRAVPWRVEAQYPQGAPSMHKGAITDDTRIGQTYFVPWWTQALLDAGNLVRPQASKKPNTVLDSGARARLVWPAVIQRAIDDVPFREAISALLWLLHDKHLVRVAGTPQFAGELVDKWPDRAQAVVLIGRPVRSYLLENYPELVGVGGDEPHPTERRGSGVVVTVK